MINRLIALLFQNWKENFTVTRPEIAENFADEIFKSATETKDEVTIPKLVWDSAIKNLAANVLAREKFDYERYAITCLVSGDLIFH